MSLILCPDADFSVVKSSKEWEWKIKNFSLKVQRIVANFTFKGESWSENLYPNNSDGYMKLRLWRSYGSPIKVDFFVAVKTTEGRRIFERRERKWFQRQDSFHDIEQWISRSEFRDQRRELLSSGCLTIVLTMKKVYCGESESESSTSQPSGSQLRNEILHDFKMLLVNQENCDVVLRVQGQEYSAHQAILTARSPVFASTFRCNMKEKETGIVDIEDIDPSCFSEFLCFLYCGETDEVSVENVRSLFTAADKYEVDGLRTMCIQFMKENLTVDVFCETLVLALLHTETELINSCTDYFIQNAEDIIETEKWKSFATENPTESIELFNKYVKSTHRMIVKNQAKKQKKC